MSNFFRYGQKLMNLLAKGIQPEEAVKTLGITLHEGIGATRRLKSRQNRRARLALAKLQRELIAAKQSPVALRCLRRVMTSPKVQPVVRLKAALAVLEEAHGKRKNIKNQKQITSLNASEKLQPIKPEEVDAIVEILQGLKQEGKARGEGGVKEGSAGGEGGRGGVNEGSISIQEG